MFKKINILLQPMTVVGIAFSTFMFYSCAHKEEKKLDEEITTDTASTAAKVQLDEILINIPSPTDITKELSKGGFNYNKGVLNSSSKGGNYSTNLKAAANLGVYGADLGYAIAYDQTQDAVAYLGTIKQLADKVGVGAAFDETLAKKFESNAGKKDSLETFINDAYNKASRNLRSNQRMSTSAVVVSGAWIEGLYIATQLAATVAPNDKNGAVYTRIWNHIYSLRYVMQLLNQYSKNADCAEIIKNFAEMEALAKEYERTPNLTQQDVVRISEKIAPMRNQMVN